MSQIHYIIGDATDPQISGRKYILHIVNYRCGWGKGFVVALSKKWREPERVYRQAFNGPNCVMLGQIQTVQVEPDLYVVNMVAQDGFGPSRSGRIPFRPLALEVCLDRFVSAIEQPASVHMPRIGCGLGEARWPDVEPIILAAFKDIDVPIYVYDLPTQHQEV